MTEKPVKLAACGGLVTAEIQQLLLLLESPDFAVDLDAIESADALVVHADRLHDAALPDVNLIVFGSAAQLSGFEEQPQVVLTIEWPLDRHAIVRAMGTAARWLRRERELQALVQTDPLTGLLNRRGFEKRARHCIGRALPEGQTSALLFIDLDHFKRINDDHGHAVGDVVLKHVAALLQRLSGPGDVIGRIGGEELAVVLPAVTAQSAREGAERFRAAIAESRVEVDGKILAVTASIGVGLSSGAGDFSTVMNEADAALYEAKAVGRNCVICSGAPPIITERTSGTGGA